MPEPEGGTPKLCFVISPIDSVGSAERRAADAVLNEIIRPAVSELNGEPYLVRRSDEEAEPGIITDQILADVLGADLVIADLSGWNPNVMYEVAVRHAKGTPIVQIVDFLPDGERLPFDISGTRTVQFGRTKLAGRSEAVAAIRAAAEAAITAGRTDNPISRAVDFGELRRRASNFERTLLEEIATLRVEVERIRLEARAFSTQTGVGRSHAEFRRRLNILAEAVSSMVDDGLRAAGVPPLRHFALASVEGNVGVFKVTFADGSEKGWQLQLTELGFIPSLLPLVQSIVREAEARSGARQTRDSLGTE